MPTSLNPPPKEDETECGNCGVYVYHGLVKRLKNSVHVWEQENR